MSKAHSEALRRHWRDPAYRAKQAASRTGASDVLTAEIVRLRDDEHMLLKDIGARLRMSGPAARARYERATTRARIAELERQLATTHEALAVAEERLKVDADIAAILAMSDEDVLAEFKAEGGDIEALSVGMRALFERVVAIVNARHVDGTQ